MQLVKLVVKRPVAVVMFYLGILLLGFVSLSRLSVDLLPDLSYPKLTVRTIYRDAVPEEVERIITEPVEQAVATVPGIRTIRSISKEGLSIVIIEFAWGRDMDFAALHVREKLDAIGRSLPDDADRPAIIRLDPSSRPVMAVSASGRELAALKELCRNVFKRRLEQIDGIAQAMVVGGREREIEVTVDRSRLETLGVTIAQMSQAIGAANVDMPGGTILKGRFRFSLRTLGAFQSLQDIENVVISRKPSGAVVFLKDVASVSMGFEDRENITRYNGEESIGLLLRKESGTNTVRVSRAVREVLDELRYQYPTVSIVLAYDQAEFISQAISNVIQAIALGGVLAFLVLFLFLHEMRNPLSISVAIPISIIATFILMHFSGVTLNLMSLGGLALGVGMLVDCSIVVLENIFRHREEGSSITDAAVTGTSEVAMAVTASTFTTIAVFLPVLYVKGVAGQLFRDQALTVTFALTASLITSLTLLPILASKFKGHGYHIHPDESFDPPGRGVPFYAKKPLVWLLLPFRLLLGYLWKGLAFIGSVFASEAVKLYRAVSELGRRLLRPVFERVDAALEKLMQRYEGLLAAALDNRRGALGIIVLLALVTAGAFLLLPRELMPRVDQGEFSIHLQLPPETSLEGTSAAVTVIEKAALARGDVLDVFANIGLLSSSVAGESDDSGLNTADIRVRMRPGASTAATVRALRRQLGSSLAAGLTFSSGETVLSQFLGSGEGDVVVRIIGANSRAVPGLIDSVETACREAGLTDIICDLRLGRPEYRLVIDRQRAGRYGLSVNTVAVFLEDNLRGRLASQFKEFDQKIGIRVRPAAGDRDSLQKLLDMLIRTEAGGVPVREMVSVYESRGATSVYRENQARTVSVYGNMPDQSLGKTVKGLRHRLNRLHLDSNVRLAVGGASEEMTASYTSLIMAVILAVSLVFMIMAAQFESLVQPLVIILAVPMAVVGTVWLLLLTGSSINVIALIGVVVLVGIAVNDAIVKIDFINQSRRKGMSLREALMEAGRKRFRPIIMTSVTTILGLLPLAIGLGEGAELQRPLALAIIGGLTSSTLLTLIYIPVIYSLVVREKLQ
ncbi:efflux RND transporter permease subunit [bacterium]|nr:efflux RND transporter permease subunit [bacterium]